MSKADITEHADNPSPQEVGTEGVQGRRPAWAT